MQHVCLKQLNNFHLLQKNKYCQLQQRSLAEVHFQLHFINYLLHFKFYFGFQFLHLYSLNTPGHTKVYNDKFTCMDVLQTSPCCLHFCGSIKCAQWVRTITVSAHADKILMLQAFDHKGTTFLLVAL